MCSQLTIGIGAAASHHIIYICNCNVSLSSQSSADATYVSVPIPPTFDNVQNMAPYIAIACVRFTNLINPIPPVSPSTWIIQIIAMFLHTKNATRKNNYRTHTIAHNHAHNRKGWTNHNMRYSFVCTHTMDDRAEKINIYHLPVSPMMMYLNKYAYDMMMILRMRALLRFVYLGELYPDLWRRHDARYFERTTRTHKGHDDARSGWQIVCLCLCECCCCHEASGELNESNIISWANNTVQWTETAKWMRRHSEQWCSIGTRTDVWIDDGKQPLDGITVYSKRRFIYMKFVD